MDAIVSRVMPGPSRSASSQETDDALVLRAAAGDRDAFKVLMERHHRPIAGLAQRLVRHPDEVDDLLQEVALRAWRGLPNFRSDAQFSTWLYRIAVNTGLKMRKRDASRIRTVSMEEWTSFDESGVGEMAEGDPLSDPAEQVVVEERSHRVRAAVAALPDKQRAVVALHYFEGRTCEEIGQEVGCSVGTVWSRLHYACKRLREALGEGWDR